MAIVTGVILASRSAYAVDEPIEIDVLAADVTEGAQLRVDHLGADVRRVAVLETESRVTLAPLDPGGYRVELVDRAGSTIAATAIQVLDPERRFDPVRYGFTTDYRPGRDLAGLTQLMRRLHLTTIQCYDWAYRHADLLGGGRTYADALGNPVDLDTVRAIVEACRSVGSRALGYAAVYGVGAAEWPRWEQHALLDGDGAPYALGDFLRVVDPATPDWLAHFTAELRAAVEAVGFDGFHLDQYGWPKRAVTPDGRLVDLAQRFPQLIAGVRAGLPESFLIFNNVNDFPTWTTARAPQDAVYIEVWTPHDRLGDLARVVTRARAEGDGRPVVIAAYLSVFATAEVVAAEQAARLTMATLFSHGATHLLVGEEGRLLVDPYYVRNWPAQPSTIDLLARWYDFLVAHDEILLPQDIYDVTGAYAAGYNDDVDVTFAGTPVSGDAQAGTVWRRVTATAYGLVVHLINLGSVSDPLWDAPQPPPGVTGAGRLRVRLMGASVPEILVGDPDAAGRLEPVEVTVAGTHACATLPQLGTWQVVLIRWGE